MDYGCHGVEENCGYQAVSLEATGFRLCEQWEIRRDNHCFLFSLPNPTNIEKAPISCWLNNCHPISRTGDNEREKPERVKHNEKSTFFTPPSLRRGKLGHCTQSIPSIAIIHYVWLGEFYLSLCTSSHGGYACACFSACVLCVSYLAELWTLPGNRWLTQFEAELCHKHYRSHSCALMCFICCRCSGSAYPSDWTDKALSLTAQSATCSDKGQARSKMGGT